ncbi:MAG: hypothetical protein KGQ41_05525 [Alphaproteobacteria bacterium]|nr:hypothetical protein [Alphaproteobacteria bacterium]
MRTRLDMMEIMLNFILGGRTVFNPASVPLFKSVPKYPMFRMPRIILRENNPEYLGNLFRPADKGMSPDAYLDAAMAAQLSFTEAAQEQRIGNRIKVLYGRDPKYTPCFYLDDLLDAFQRNMGDRGLRGAQFISKWTGRGGEFIDLLDRMSRLRDYSPYFPEHPRKGKKTPLKGWDLGAIFGDWGNGPMVPNPVRI